MTTLTVFLIMSLKQLAQFECSCLGEERAICLWISSLDSSSGTVTVTVGGLFFPLLSLSLTCIFIGAEAPT